MKFSTLAVFASALSWAVADETVFMTVVQTTTIYDKAPAGESSVTMIIQGSPTDEVLPSTSELDTTLVTQSNNESLPTGDVYEDIGKCSGLNETFARAILDFHNKARKIHQVGPMRWNKTVWEYAQNVADKYVCGSGLKHTGGQYGENLFAGGSVPEVAGNAWYDEEKDWHYGVNDKQYSHFSQMVWKDSTELGCAYHFCPYDTKLSYPGYFVICNYYVFGNMMGQQKFQVLPPIKSLESLVATSSPT